jgi:hypothetical protein
VAQSNKSPQGCSNIAIDGHSAWRRKRFAPLMFYQREPKMFRFLTKTFQIAKKLRFPA